MRSLDNLRAYGWDLTLTDNVYKCGKIASTAGDVRAKAFHSLIEDKNIDVVLAACGGDMLMEMLDYLDYERISASPKWIMGYSDITGLLLPITLKCDIATVYGPNAGSFDMTELHPTLKSVFPLLEGRPQVQHSSKMHERHRVEGLDGYNLDTDTGHVKPMMPLVNGALTRLTVCGKGGTVEQSFS